MIKKSIRPFKLVVFLTIFIWNNCLFSMNFGRLILIFCNICSYSMLSIYVWLSDFFNFVSMNVVILVSLSMTDKKCFKFLWAALKYFPLNHEKNCKKKIQIRKNQWITKYSFFIKVIRWAGFMRVYIWVVLRYNYSMSCYVIVKSD